MPSVYLTEAQRTDERYRKLRHSIGDRVALCKHRERLKLVSMAKSLGMGHATLSKLMDGEDVLLSTTRFLQILDLAGLKIVEKRKDALEVDQ